MNDTPIVPRRRALLTLLVLIPIGLILLGREIGNKLVYQDELVETCEAAVVFGGGLPFRAMEAASIYTLGKVKSVWLTRGPISEEDVALSRVGVERPPEHVYSALALERLGVPAEAQRVLNGRVQNTAEEVQRVSRELDEIPGACIVLVTSKVHSRRVRITWDLLAAEQQRAFVRYASEDPFEPASWWSTTDSILSVVRESGGIVNALLGFPIATEREAAEVAERPQPAL